MNHIALLSEAMHYLNNDSITVSELECAGKLLKKNVRVFQKYFGIISMSSNIHLLTLMIKCIRNWGPTWGHSAFVFEAWNKRLLDKLTSSHCRAEQIITRFLMEKIIIAPSSDNRLSIETRNYMKKVLQIPLMDLNIDSQSKICGQGNSIVRLPTLKEIQALHSACYSPNNFTSYKKMNINKVKYCCHTEKRSVKFRNSVINDGNGTYGIIQSIFKFNHGNSTVSSLLVLTYNEEECAFQTRHIKKVKNF